ncbi:hypothetical protein AVEN_6522-1, partial [Araneus ventricosus]
MDENQNIKFEQGLETWPILEQKEGNCLLLKIQYYQKIMNHIHIEGIGDYPKFEKFHMESRNPFAPYDYPELKRNYGEPLHPDYDICIEDKVNFQTKYWTPPWKMLLYVVSGVTIYSTLILYGEFNPVDNRR